MSQNMQVSKSCLDFVSKCLTFDPDRRISIDHALNHPFINSASPQYIEQIDIFHPVEPQKMKNFYKITTAMESRMFSATQNEFLRAKFLKNACFLNIHERKYLKCVPKANEAKNFETSHAI
jgi:serine/threonine protein kinase